MRLARPLDSTDPIHYFRPFFLPGLVFIALVLRLWHVRHGLPDVLEESAPLKLALGLRDAASGDTDWNPHQFHHPTLILYLHFLVQQLMFVTGNALGVWRSYADYLMSFYVDPSVMVVAARLVGIGFDALSVVAAYRLGRRLHPGSAVLAGMFVAFSPALIVASRSIGSGPVMMACVLWAVDQLLEWHEHGGTHRLLAAASLVGLASGVEYLAAVLAVPMLVLAWRRGPRTDVRGALARVGLAAGCALAAFIVTTPYAALDFATFMGDLKFEIVHGLVNIFGGSPRGLGFHAGQLASNLGGPIVLLLLCSLALAIAYPRRRVPTWVLWTGLVAFALPVSMSGGEEDPSTLAMIAIAAVLGAASLHAASSPFRRSVRRTLLVVLLATTAGPTLFTGLRAAWIGADTTQLSARRWCERYLRPGDVMVLEGYGARIASESQVLGIESSPEFRLASSDIQNRIATQRTFQVVSIPHADAGRIVSLLSPKGHALREVDVFSDASDLDQVFYDPRLYSECDYIMTSERIRKRYEVQPRRFPVECAFYRLLDATCEVVQHFRPQGAVEGPEIRVYRIGSRYRAAIEARGVLDSLWWSKCIPNGYRGLATRMLLTRPDFAPDTLSRARVDAVTAANSSPASYAMPSSRGTDTDSAGAATTEGTATTTPAPPPAWVASPDSSAPGELPPWIQSLRPLYDRSIRRFSDQMSVALAKSGRYDAAARFALATLALHPEDDTACMVFSVCSRQTGAEADARRAIERTLAAPRRRPVDPGLRLEYARVLDALGDHDQARTELSALTSISDKRNLVGAEARRLLATDR